MINYDEFIWDYIKVININMFDEWLNELWLGYMLESLIIVVDAFLIVKGWILMMILE